MNVVIAGASGLIGTALASALNSRGDTVTRLVRHDPVDDNELQWHPESGELDAPTLDGVDAVICLSGKGIADGRWTSRTKREILESRVSTVELLSRRIAEVSKPPAVFVCASAIGIYGTTNQEEAFDESSPAGDDFLSGVCTAWEEAAGKARTVTRVVHARLGVVLTPSGGALARMLPVFRVGLGGPLGTGEQSMSWIALEDAVAAILHSMDNAEVKGAVNIVAPNPVNNQEFSQSLATALRRPCLFRVPGFVVRLALGEMGEALLLNGAKVVPGVLERKGFQFMYPDIEDFWESILV